MVSTRLLRCIPVVAIISSTLTTSASLSQSILSPAEFLTYENDNFGFRIQYPSDWTKEEENTSKSNVNIVVSFFKLNRSQPYTEADVYIRTEKFLGKTITLEEFTKLQKAYMSSLLAISRFNETKMTIGNMPVWQLEYEFKGIGGTLRQGMNSLIVIGNTGYSIVFTADEEKYTTYKPLVQMMIDSFQIKTNTDHKLALTNLNYK